MTKDKKARRTYLSTGVAVLVCHSGWPGNDRQSPAPGGRSHDATDTLHTPLLVQIKNVSLLFMTSEVK